MKDNDAIVKINSTEGSRSQIIATFDILRVMLNLLYSVPIDQEGEVDEIMSALIDSRKMSMFERFKFKRAQKIFNKASITIDGNNNHVGKIVMGDYHEIHLNFDWYMKFFNSATETGNDILQEIWAKILANEITHPDTCSLRTLDIVKNMSAEEAKSFEKICKYIVYSGDFDHFIFDVGFTSNLVGNEICRKYITDDELNFEADILPLQECNLISRDRTLAFDYNSPAESTLYMKFEDLMLALNFSKEIERRINIKEVDRLLFQEDVYFLTKSGIELYRSLKNTGGIDTEIGYLIACFLYYEKRYSNVKAELRLKSSEGYTDDLLTLSKKHAKQCFSDEVARDEALLIPLICQIIQSYREGN